MIRWRFMAYLVTALFALAAAVAALLWPTDTVLNVVGAVLLVCQIGSLAIVLNPLATGRWPCRAFLLVSGVHTYWPYWVRKEFDLNATRSEVFWSAPVAASLQMLLEWLTNSHASKIVPSGPLAYLWDFEVYQFEEVGILLTSLLLGFISAWIAVLIAKRFRRDANVSSPSPRFQLSVRTLLLYTLVIALALGWAVRERRICEKFRAAINVIGGEDTMGHTNHPRYFPWFNSLVWLDTPAETSAVFLLKNVNDDQLKALADFRSLRQVYIESYNEGSIDDSSLAHLRRVPGLRSVALNDFDLTVAALEHLDGLPLEELTLQHLGGLNDREFAKLRQYKNLKSLEVSSNVFTSEALVHLAAFPQLESLKLHTVEFNGPKYFLTAKGAAAIGSLRRLKALYLDMIVSEEALAHLSNLTALEEINLPHYVSESDAAQLRITSLRRLDCPAPLPDNLTAWIGSNKNLRSLHLSHATLSDRGAQHLASLEHLEYAYLPHADLNDNSLRHFSNLKKLHDLYISGAGITDVGVQHLAMLPELEDLRLNGTSITNASLPIIEQFPKLRYVSLSGTGVDAAAVQEVNLRKKRRRVNFHIYYKP